MNKKNDKIQKKEEVKKVETKKIKLIQKEKKS